MSEHSPYVQSCCVLDLIWAAIRGEYPNYCAQCGHRFDYADTQMERVSDVFDVLKEQP